MVTEMTVMGSAHSPCRFSPFLSMIKIISPWRQSTVSGRLGSSVGRVLTSDQILIKKSRSLLTKEKMVKPNVSRLGGHVAPETPLNTLGSFSFQNRVQAALLGVVSTNLHGLFVDRIIPRTIAHLKSITQVRDRSLGFEK